MISNGEIRAAIKAELDASWPERLTEKSTGAFLDRATAEIWHLLEHHETQEQIEPIEITVTVKNRGKHLVTATHTLDTLAPRDEY